MPELPQVEPQDARRRAEQCLTEDITGIDTPRGLAWALLAVAGELHEIRKLLKRR